TTATRSAMRSSGPVRLPAGPPAGRSPRGWCSRPRLPGRPARAARAARPRAPRARALPARRALDRPGGPPPAEEILSSMKMDKKFRGGARFVLLEDVGRPFLEDAVPRELVRAGLHTSV